MTFLSLVTIPDRYGGGWKDGATLDYTIDVDQGDTSAAHSEQVGRGPILGTSLNLASGTSVGVIEEEGEAVREGGGSSVHDLHITVKSEEI
jgi:hypothetical protein